MHALRLCWCYRVRFLSRGRRRRSRPQQPTAFALLLSPTTLCARVLQWHNTRLGSRVRSSLALWRAGWLSLLLLLRSLRRHCRYFVSWACVSERVVTRPLPRGSRRASAGWRRRLAAPCSCKCCCRAAPRLLATRSPSVELGAPCRAHLCVCVWGGCASRARPACCPSLLPHPLPAPLSQVISQSRGPSFNALVPRTASTLNSSDGMPTCSPCLCWPSDTKARQACRP